MIQILLDKIVVAERKNEIVEDLIPKITEAYDEAMVSHEWMAQQLLGVFISFNSFSRN